MYYLASEVDKRLIAAASEFDIRGRLAAGLKCWHRLSEEESDELVAFVAALQSPAPSNAGAQRAA
jgi:hypothetical protein